MAKTIEKGATHLDKLCHKIYDEPKGCGFQVDGECIRCGGPLLDYYCEERLHLIVCKKCGTLALTKACAPQVAANLTLSRKPTLTQPNEWVSVEERLPEPGERVLATDCGFVGEFYINERGQWQRYNVNCHALLMALDILYWMPLPEPPESRPTEGEGST